MYEHSSRLQRVGRPCKGWTVHVSEERNGRGAPRTSPLQAQLSLVDSVFVDPNSLLRLQVDSSVFLLIRGLTSGLWSLREDIRKGPFVNWETTFSLPNHPFWRNDHLQEEAPGPRPPPTGLSQVSSPPGRGLDNVSIPWTYPTSLPKYSLNLQQLNVENEEDSSGNGVCHVL